MTVIERNRQVVAALMHHLGGSFAAALGIELAGAREGELFKWLLASFLYGARISELIATRAYREFERRQVVSPQAILSTGWDGLVRILDDGGYVRYDFSTARNLLAVAGDLVREYGGNLNNVHAAAKDARDLEARLQRIGKGIGPVTANIFLRELRGIWPKARPMPSALVLLSAEALSLLPGSMTGERALARLESLGRQVGIGGVSLADFEAALVRLGIRYCRRKRHASCPMTSWCRLGTGQNRSA